MVTDNFWENINKMLSKAFLFLPLTILLLLLICIPQINIASYPQPTILSKFLVFAYTSILLFGLLIFLLITSKRQIGYLSKLDVALTLLFIYILINRYLIQSEYSFSIRYLELLGLGLFYILIRNIKPRIQCLLFIAIIISGILQAIYGNLQLLEYYPSNHPGFKITGSFFNPGPYAGFLSAVFPLALGIYLFKERITKQLLFNCATRSYEKVNLVIRYGTKYIPLLGIISIVLVLPATQSRGAWLAILLSNILLLELRYQFFKKLFKQASIAKKSIVIVGILLAIGLGLFSIYQFKKGSSDGRLFIWKISSKIIKDNPAFGIGFDRFKAHYMNYQAQYFEQNGETQEVLVADNSYYAFNEFIQFTTEQGILGLLLLLSILFLIINAKASKNNRSLNTIVKVSLLTISVFAFFSYPTEILPIKLILVVLIAVLASLNTNKTQISLKLHNKFYLLLLKIPISIGVLSIAIYGYRHINTLDEGFKNWGFALSSYQYHYETAIEEYEIAYPVLKNNGEFLMNYGKALFMNNQDKKALDILKQAKLHLNTTIIETALGDTHKNLKQYDKAEAAYLRASQMVPARFYPLYLLAKLFEENEEKEKALVIANTILNKKIKIPSTAIKEIQQEMKDLIQKYSLNNE